MMKIKTKQLILKSVDNINDVEALAILLKDSSLVREAGLVLPDNNSQRMTAIKTLACNNHLLLIVHQKTQQLIGLIVLSQFHGHEGQPLHKQYELGYLLKKSDQNNGYMTEAVQRMIKMLPDNAVIHAMVIPLNKASQRVLQKCGFHCITNEHWVFEKLAI